MRTTIFLSLLAATLNGWSVTAFSLSMQADNNNKAATTGRRTFLSKTVASTAGAVVTASAGVVLEGAPQSALAAQEAKKAPEVKKSASGRIKYAILKEAKQDNPPQKGDLVAIEYTGYLTNGKIFDGTHGEGKKNFLLFEVGGNAVIDGVNEMVMEMGVGEKVQAIIPAELAFKDKGICLDNGECLIKPGESLVYDIALKRSAIPPP